MQSRPKPFYCLTQNGKKMSIVDSLAEASMHIAACSIDYVDGKYVQSPMIGTLIARDIAGNVWSVCRVNASVAALVTRNFRKRHAKAWKAFLESAE